MVILPHNATEDDVLSVVRQWVGLLAAGDYVQAQSLLLREGAERDWPPEMVAQLIASYELPPAVSGEELSRVTPVGEARVFDIQPRAAVSRWEGGGRPGVVGDVHFNLPINGIWSDLT